MLIVRPDYDKGTNYLFFWSQEVIDFAQDKNWHVEKSDREKAIRHEFESRLKNNPGFVFINGHGNDDTVIGHDRQPLVDTYNCFLLKGTITFTRACNCIKSLGKKAVVAGCTTFIGYNREFWVPRLHKFEATPLKDPLAKPVVEVSNAVPLSLIKGNSVEDAIGSSATIAEKHILKLILSKEQYDRVTLKAMINNLGALDYEGEKTAKINE